MKILIAIAIGTYLVFVGVFIGATDYESAVTNVKWTDVASLIVTFLGFAFGFITYFQWVSNKQKEDAYLSAKKYLAALDEIDEHLHELRFHYNHICPAPGVIVEDEEVSIKRIKHLSYIVDNLYLARRNLYKSKRELAFWNVTLSHEFEITNNHLNSELDSLSIIAPSLNSQLYILVTDDWSNSGEVVRLKKQFDALYKSAHDINLTRIAAGFNDIFRFESKVN
ncbi:hypothetical protein MUK41_004342 [Vibrio vulnificus]|nr:hypothetical protein [Vibrio vulnificus]EIV8618641.1 hypothetical protein [Vibrio vulnificus]EIZ4627366.1 hypothetical protein [Vibrio vulnificus]EJB0301398.1 hypothetical protein [Vibrio vulnificus]